MSVKKFSDFAKEGGPLEGDKVKIKTILNQEIFVTKYRIKKSKYAKNGADQCLTIQFEIDGIKKIFFTGSNILIEQIEKYENEIPFMTMVKKIDKYYTFS